jgi:hypothetical protein
MTSLILQRRDHKRAMLTALHLRWTFGELLRTALREWLARHEAKGLPR